MEPQSSLPVRSSGIPRPSSRLPVLRPSGSQSQLRPTASTSTEPLRKRPSLSSFSRPSNAAQAPSVVQRKTSRSSLVRSTTPSTTSLPNTSSNRASLASSTKRTIPGSTAARKSPNDSVFKKPIGRPPSRQTKTKPESASTARRESQEDVLGDLDGFRSASRASSRAGFREESEAVIESDSEPAKPPKRKGRPSLSDRTIESLSQLPASPAGKGRRRSSFFSADNSMPPPARPASAMSNNGRPVTSDGTPRATPATPKRPAGMSLRGSMTAPGKRSISASVPSTTTTPSKPASVVRPVSTLRKQPLSQMQNNQNTPKPRPLSNSKTMTARTPRTRPSLSGLFGQAVSPPATAVPLTPSPDRETVVANVTPVTGRKTSSSAAFRDQIAKAKAARRSDVGVKSADSPPAKVPSSSNALREQIAKAKEAARRANSTRSFRTDTPPREVPAVTENEHGIQPDPAEISQFDFGLDDPFNQSAKGSKSLLRKRIDAARVEGRLNIAAMGLAEFPEDVLTMYKYDPNDTTVAWGEVVDLTTIIAADNEFDALPDRLFPDIDMETFVETDEEDGPQFGAVQSIDLHGNTLQQLPVGMKRLTMLSKLNLSRNQLNSATFDVITQISTLRELRLGENKLGGALPASLGRLTQLEVLELQGNQLSSLPSEIRELVRLRTLNVSDNSLSQIPSEVFTSVPIIELIASKNKFKGPIFDVDTVPHLQTLQLSNTSLTSLCSSGTVLLPALKTLDLSTNRLTSLPDMSSWTSLTTLLVGENKLTALPEGFISLQKLRTADFTANDLTKLDEKIALMESLDNLTIAANPLRERKFLTMDTSDLKRDLLSRIAPSDVDVGRIDENAALDAPTEAQAADNGWQLKPSGTLDLSLQNLTEVDEEAIVAFAESNDVRQLYLQQNYLTTIPIVSFQLTHLTLLDLSKNNISRPLSGTLSLPKLRELRLSGNKMQSLDDLMSLLSAPSLQHLDVSQNRISGPLPTLRAVFPELLLLMASDNTITDVSADALEGFKIVNLSNNEIPRLDPRIGLLQGKLTAFDVEGNTFRVPNYAIVQKGTESVLNWLRDKIPSPVEESF